MRCSPAITIEVKDIFEIKSPLTSTLSSSHLTCWEPAMHRLLLIVQFRQACRTAFIKGTLASAMLWHCRFRSDFSGIRMTLLVSAWVVFVFDKRNDDFAQSTTVDFKKECITHVGSSERQSIYCKSHITTVLKLWARSAESFVENISSVVCIQVFHPAASYFSACCGVEG